jgi:peroxiredoxin
LGLLLTLFDLYRPGDDFFPAMHKELLSVQKTFNDSILLMSDTDPTMLSSSIISLYQEPLFDPLKEPDLDEFMRINYLKPVSFDDPRLLNTPVITNKILTYLSFFRVQTDQETQELAFIQAVDNIMAEVSYNEELYDFVLNYLIDGFERFQMERVLVHIADNHLTGECKTENEEIVKERLDAYKRMAEGNKVPDINLLDPFDQPHRLSDLDDEIVLLIFWSSECPHCTNMLPRLNEWYKEDKGSLDLEVYTVSIDKSRADWEEFVLLNELEGINVYDPDGWESKTSRQFNLYATPTMFLLDRERKILAKPVTFKEFLKALD